MTCFFFIKLSLVLECLIYMIAHTYLTMINRSKNDLVKVNRHEADEHNPARTFSDGLLKVLAQPPSPSPFTPF